MGTVLGVFIETEDYSMANQPKRVYQFKITLEDFKPHIWRRIQVPEKYSFWDLHVAIQDAMGWTDSHLHQFEVIDPKQARKVYIGIPSEDEEFEGMPKILDGWNESIGDCFSEDGINRCRYEYDFGDGWRHEIKLEKIFPAIPGCKYPLCIEGERACPPEDCGGVWGYENFLKIMRDPKHEEYQSMLEWVGYHFDPENFEPQKVIFSNPKKRRQQ